MYIIFRNTHPLPSSKFCLFGVNQLDIPRLLQKQIWTESSKKGNSSRIKQGQNSEPKPLPLQVNACLQLIALLTFNTSICKAGRVPTFQSPSTLTSPMSSLSTLEIPPFPFLKSVDTPVETCHWIRTFQIPPTKPPLNSIPYAHAGSTVLSNFCAETEYPSCCPPSCILSRLSEKMPPQPFWPYPWWSHHTLSGRVPPGCTAAGYWGHQRGSCCAEESHQRSAACPQFSKTLPCRNQQTKVTFFFIYIFLYVCVVIYKVNYFDPVRVEHSLGQ